MATGYLDAFCNTEKEDNVITKHYCFECEFLSIKTKSPPKNELCVKCDNPQILTQCMDCLEAKMCFYCTLSHLKLPACSSHKVLPIPDLLRYCNVHEEFQLTSYCKDCEVPLCERCFCGSHKGHDTEDTSIRNKPVLPQLMEMMSNLNTEGYLAIKKRDKLRQKIQLVEVSAKVELERLRKEKEQKIDWAEKDYQAIVDVVRKYEQMVNDCDKALNDEIKWAIPGMNHLGSYADLITSHARSFGMLCDMKELKEKTYDVINKKKDMDSLDTCKELTFVEPMLIPADEELIKSGESETRTVTFAEKKY